jgi:hypothetical protein
VERVFGEGAVRLEMIVERLGANAEVMAALVAHVDAEQAAWRPAPEAWSILEVVNHLADLEVEDFRTRLGLTLERPEEAWPPIDPVGWPVARAYRVTTGREVRR